MTFRPPNVKTLDNLYFIAFVFFVQIDETALYLQVCKIIQALNRVCMNKYIHVMIGTPRIKTKLCLMILKLPLNKTFCSLDWIIRRESVRHRLLTTSLV